MPECIIEGHSMCIWSLACMDTGSCSIISASNDGSIRQWGRDGEAVGELLGTDEGVISLAVSPDETMVVSGSASRRLHKGGQRCHRPVGGAQCCSEVPRLVSQCSGDSKRIERRHHTTMEPGKWPPNRTTSKDWS